MATKAAKKQSIAERFTWTNEIISILVLGVTVLLFLCLVSYHQDDPTFFTASSQKIQNWIGIVGAYIAAILIAAIGWVAYIVPALLALIAWRIFQSENLKLPVGR